MKVAFKDKLSEFGILSVDQMEKAASYATKRSYKKGEYFFKAGTANTELGYIISGVFRYFVIDEKGNENTSVFMTEGDLFTELESFQDEETTRGYFQAETDTNTLIFGRTNYHLMVSEIKGMEYIVNRIFQRKLLGQLRFYRTILALEAKKSYLLLLGHYPSVVSRVPDNHLASYLGITKHSLSRIKKKIMADLK